MTKTYNINELDDIIKAVAIQDWREVMLEVYVSGALEGEEINLEEYKEILTDEYVEQFLLDDGMLYNIDGSVSEEY